MRDDELIGRMRKSAAAFWTLQSRHSVGGDAIEIPGVTASVTPAVPDPPFFNFFNAVFYEDEGGLGRNISAIEAVYRRAGVRKWMVWVLERDREVETDLNDRGYQLSGKNFAMGIELDIDKRNID